MYYTTIFSEKPWVIVTPTYAWLIPDIVYDWLSKTRLKGPSILEAANAISSDRAIKDQIAHTIGQILSGPVNRGFNRFYVKADKFFVKETCVSCGKRETVCPLENISLYEGKPIWGKDCTHCMACICHCPTEVIEYGKASYGKRRYKCPV